MIYDTYGIRNAPTRTDISVYSTGAMAAATEGNRVKMFNIMVLGGLLKVVPNLVEQEHSIEMALKKSLPERYHHMIPQNLDTIKEGSSLIQSAGQ